MALIPGAFATSGGAVILPGGGGGGGGPTPNWSTVLAVGADAGGQKPVVDAGIEVVPQAAAPTVGAGGVALWGDSSVAPRPSLLVNDANGVTHDLLADTRIDTTIAPAPPNPLITTLVPGVAPLLYDAAAGVTHQIAFPPSTNLPDGALCGVYMASGFASDTIELIPGAPADVVVGLDGVAGAPGATVTIPPGTIPAGTIMALWRLVTSTTDPTWAFVGYSASPLSGGGSAPDWNTTLAQGNIASTVDPYLQEPRRIVYGFRDYGGLGTIQTRSLRTFRTLQSVSVGGSPPPFEQIGDPILPDVELMSKNYVLLRAEGIASVANPALFAQPFVVEEVWQDSSRVAIYRREGLGTIGPNTSGEVGFSREPTGYVLRIRGDIASGVPQYMSATVDVTFIGGPAV